MHILIDHNILKWRCHKSAIIKFKWQPSKQQSIPFFWKNKAFLVWHQLNHHFLSLENSFYSQNLRKILSIKSQQFFLDSTKVKHVKVYTAINKSATRNCKQKHLITPLSTLKKKDHVKGIKHYALNKPNCNHDLNQVYCLIWTPSA